MTDTTKYHDMNDHDLLITVAVNADASFHQLKELKEQVKTQNSNVASLQTQINLLPCAVSDERISTMENNKNKNAMFKAHAKIALLSASVGASVVLVVYFIG